MEKGKLNVLFSLAFLNEKNKYTLIYCYFNFSLIYFTFENKDCKSTFLLKCRKVISRDIEYNRIDAIMYDQWKSSFF